MEVAAALDIDASASEVWSTLKHFDGVTRWAPGVIECTSKGSGVGAVRTLKMKDGMTIVERLESYDDAGRSFSYSIVDAPIPVKNYLSRVSVASKGHQCTVNWNTSGEPVGIAAEHVEKILRGICQGGVRAIKSHCELQGTTQVRRLRPEDV